MDTQGYAELHADALGRGVPAKDQHLFQGKVVRVVEFSPEGDVLVISPCGTRMGDFAKMNVLRSFACHVEGEVVCPPGLNLAERMLYSLNAMNRKGGYCQTVKWMVIVASLAKGTFTDDFIWQVEREERARAAAQQKAAGHAS
jgi:hypothetical protein